MKKLPLLLLAFVLLCACTPRKEKTMLQLENLVAEAQSHSKDYTADDWAQFITEYKTIDSLLLLDEFTQEEYNHISELKGQCAGYLVKAGASQFKEQIGNTVKGFFNALSGKDDDDQ